MLSLAAEQRAEVWRVHARRYDRGDKKARPFYADVALPPEKKKGSAAGAKAGPRGPRKLKELSTKARKRLKGRADKARES